MINGRKWFITGAAHPDCKLLIVLCRDADGIEGDKHHSHIMVLVPMDTPGVSVVRNIAIMQHHSPEGHCELLFRAMQVFGAMGLSPDTPLAYFWTWGRAMHFLDGPDEVHRRTVARHELDRARENRGATAAYFTLPESPSRLE